MKKLSDLKEALAENVLSASAAIHIKGGDSPEMTEDEKRRQRPGGGISTNRPTIVGDGYRKKG